MDAIQKSYIDKRYFLLLVFTSAFLLSHLELVEDGFSLPTAYIFPFTAFIVNSFYIAIGLFIFQAFTDFLDQKIPWQPETTKRFAIQLAISLIIYLVFQYLIVFGIEPVFNNNHSTPIRIILTFGLGVFLVLLINLLSLLIHFRQKSKVNNVPLTDFLQGTSKGKKVVIPKQDFLLFYIESGVVFGLASSHQKIILKESLIDLEKTLRKELFFRVNRKQIIAKKAIQSVTYNGSESATIKISNRREEVLISRRRVPAFKKWIKTA